MEQKLQELQLLKTKLITLLGEVIGRLNQSGQLRLLYTSAAADNEKDVRKIFRLLDHVQVRITKVEERVEK
ncbi:MAG: hypothetical protein HQL23_02725 [Candidatus Omnitrophica bacterium]|nr:hypothetical protein [Candidatus Omnitrophota bacterium]